MWYRYLNRNLDNLRIFRYELFQYRKANLKFNQDDLGLFSFKVLNRPKELLFKMARTEGNVCYLS